jgi:dTDP-4-dehydrorhamnose reductase
MKILVIGRGWVGNKVYNELKQRNHSVQITSHENAEGELWNNRWKWVVNCAGKTGTPNVDACELNKQETYEANVNFPIRIFNHCNHKGIKFAHFSSGCIYEGNIDSVDAKPNFFGSTYSISKGISDTYLKDKALVFRIRMPFTNIDEPKNFLSKLKHYAKNGKLFDGGLNSITDLNEAVKVACDLIEEWKTGPYNLVNSGAMTIKDICNFLNIKGEWCDENEFLSITNCKRSNCIIPAYEKMKSINEALYENRF